MKSFAGIFRTTQTIIKKKHFEYCSAVRIFFLLRQFDGRLDLYEKL